MRSWSALALTALLLATLPLMAKSAAEGVQKTSGPVDELVLDNGMTVLVVSRPDQPLVTAAWAVRTGSGDERPGRGVSHLLEHLLFRGTEVVGTRDWSQESRWMARRDALASELRRLLEAPARKGGAKGSRATIEIEREIQGLERNLQAVRIPGELARLYAEGGIVGVDAQTTKDFSVYSARVPASRLELWFWLESDRLLRPVFRGLADEVAVVEAERRQRLESTAMGRSLEDFDAVFWGERHPYSWSTDGLAGGLQELSRADVRAYFEHHYRPCNLVAVLVGDVDPSTVGDLAERYFGRLENGGRSGPCGTSVEGAAIVDESAAASRSASPSQGRRVERACECPRQVELRFRTVAFSDPDSVALEVVAGLLNGRTGRLHRALVQDLGIAFSASASSYPLRRAGSFSLFATEHKGAPQDTPANPPKEPVPGDPVPDEAPGEPIQTAAKLEAALLDQLERLRVGPISEAELSQVENRIRTDLARQSKSSIGLASRLLIYDALDDWRAFERRPEQSQSVTVERVREVVSKYLQPDQAWVFRLEPPSEIGMATPGSHLPSLGASSTRSKDSVTAVTAPRQAAGAQDASESTPSDSKSMPPNADSKANNVLAIDVANAQVSPTQSEPARSRRPRRDLAPVPARPELLRFAAPVYPSPEAERYRFSLSNGLPVYVVEDHTVPLIDVVLALPVGEFLEQADQLGVASLTAAMLRRGGTERWAADAFDERADRLAIEINSVGGLYRSGVTLDSSPEVFDQALELWAEMLRRPRFDERRVSSAVSSLEASRAARAQEPTADLERSWNELLLGPGHFRSRRMTLADVRRIDASALRTFYRQHWQPEGAAIAVSGDVDTREVLLRLEDLLGGWKSEADLGQGDLGREGGAVAREVSDSRDPVRSGSPGVYQMLVGDPATAVAGRLLLGHEGALRSSWNDPEMFAVMVMSEILAGNGAISRLSSRLRAHENLVYQVDASFGIGLEERGLFQVGMTVTPENAARAAGLVVEEMVRLQREPPPAVELDLARRALIDAFPLLFDSAEKRAGRFAEDALLGRPHDYWRSYREGIAKVGADDVTRAARRYLQPKRLRVLWSGSSLHDQEWRFLGLGPVKNLDVKNLD